MDFIEILWFKPVIFIIYLCLPNNVYVYNDYSLVFKMLLFSYLITVYAYSSRKMLSEQR